MSSGWLTALPTSLLTHAYDVGTRSHPGSPHCRPFVRESTRHAALWYWYCFVVRLDKLLHDQSIKAPWSSEAVALLWRHYNIKEGHWTIMIIVYFPKNYRLMHMLHTGKSYCSERSRWTMVSWYRCCIDSIDPVLATLLYNVVFQRHHEYSYSSEKQWWRAWRGEEWWRGSKVLGLHIELKVHKMGRNIRAK